MPWRLSNPMSERLRFVQEVALARGSFSEVCARYEISRKTGYLWWSRFACEGAKGLEARSRRPHRQPKATPPRVKELLLAERRRHPSWGPKKLLAVLSRKHPDLALPAVSTAARILKLEGLIGKRRRRGRPARVLVRQPHWGSEPNELWTADHKGQFRLGGGGLCYPVTIADSCTRFLLRISACTSTRHEQAQPIFESAFKEYGLPGRILTDNGVPFGSRAVVGLSRLSAWWLKLGIQVERIEPGRPEQNGQHERMHRTLKREATKPSKSTAKAQQRCFDRFRQEFNEERPHEALAMQTPAQYYRASPRLYTRETPGLDYPATYERRQVRNSGEIKWRGQLIFISSVLSGDPVGLFEETDGIWAVCFGPVLIGRIWDGEARLRRPSPAGSRPRMPLPM